ncbi:MAG: hypothetical protein Q9201_003837 [Fulgogasparrea decipioides]
MSKYEIPKVKLFEFDMRFQIFPEFVYYDFAKPTTIIRTTRLNFTASWKLTSIAACEKGSYDRILCDPPFLSTDCQTKVAITVRWLSKISSNGTQEQGPRIIVCTGERMEELVYKLYHGIKTTEFRPKHAKDRLSNDFRCYANFESELWKSQQQEAANGNVADPPK